MGKGQTQNLVICRARMHSLWNEDSWSYFTSYEMTNVV